VVGAGLSGLATAIATSLAGHHVTVFESAKELREVSEILTSLLVVSTRANREMQRLVPACK
jgi:salicylate hydroxylase